MKKLIFLIILSMYTFASADQTVQFTWHANNTPDLAGYYLYQATVSNGQIMGKYEKIIPAMENPTTTLVLIKEGTYYWKLTAFDVCGNESDFSHEVSLTYDSTPPEPPTGLQAIFQRLISFFKSIFGIHVKFV